MTNAHITTASAGSGKTYRLSALLHEKISSGEVRPEAVIATTFTKKAAAELQERVRQRLIGEGLTGKANRLAAARMGTVNAICSRLVTDFAFEKGLFPETVVLDEALESINIRAVLPRSGLLAKPEVMTVMAGLRLWVDPGDTLAADRPELDDRHRLDPATGIVKRWNISGVINPNHLLQAANNFSAWVKKKYPKAVWRRE